ncbi:MAG TPA: TetR/AcrR family transcriptional regulator [Terriglobales bacterium]|nr:TetR/AcrR family transcriptional regulator [Terriglobales bacterium]
MRKLLDATREVLARYGLEGTTIPRIATHAGLTPGSVYRRFQDKEALLETAILEILERQEETMKTSLTPLATNQIPLQDFAATIIGGMVGAYRANAGLLRGIRQFMQARVGTPFWKKVSALEATHFQRTVHLFLLYRKEIHHPDPPMAVSLVLRMVAGTLFQIVVWPVQSKEMKNLLPRDDDALAKEITRAFLSYLAVKI